MVAIWAKFHCVVFKIVKVVNTFIYSQYVYMYFIYKKYEFKMSIIALYQLKFVVVTFVQFLCVI